MDYNKQQSNTNYASNRTQWQGNTSSTNNNNMNGNMNSNTNNNMNQMPVEYERASDGSVSMNGFTTPPQQSFNSPEMRGQIQPILADNVGEYVVVEFLVGTDMIMRKQGIIYFVGTSYLTLYDDQHNNFILCDLFSIKFIYFYYPGDRPNYNFNPLSSNS